MTENKENVESSLAAKLAEAKENDLFAAARESLKDGLAEKSKKLLDEGKRHVIGQDFAGALKPLAECCHLIATNFGEMDDKLAEPAYYYGMAMLEEARAQQNVFGDGVGDEKKEEEQPEEEKKKSLSPVKENSKNEEDADSEEEEEDEADDQIAHEWLEIARVLYNKREGKDHKLKEAECLGLLADLKSENGQLEDARADYDASLEIYKAHLDQNDRKIATVLYQRGSVELFLQMPKEATESFRASLKIVKSIIESKKKQIKDDTEGVVVGKLLPEVEALEELVPEIDEKITEAVRMNEDYVKMKATLASAFGFGQSGFDKTGESSGTVNTLQVKRKAKPTTDQAAKKPKN